LLGKCIRGRTANQKLAAALFTTSIADSHAKLIDANTLHFDLTATLLEQALERGDDLHYIAQVLPTLHQHPRINTYAKLCNLICDPHGPTLEDAMSLNKQQLKSKHSNMRELPLTTDEQQMRQLEEAIMFYNGSNKAAIATSSSSQPAAAAEQEDEEEEEEEEDGQWETKDLSFLPHELQWNVPLLPGSEYTWHRCVWYRINVALMLMRRMVKQFGRDHCMKQKLTRFIQAHLPLVQYIDSLPSCKNSDMDVAHLCALYVSPGLATYPDDYDLCKTTHTIRTIRSTPLQLIERHWPDLVWRVEQAVQLDDQQLLGRRQDIEGWIPAGRALPLAGHRIYYACLLIINQCKDCASQAALSSDLIDALWVYRCAFADIFCHVVCGERARDVRQNMDTFETRLCEIEKAFPDGHWRLREWSGQAAATLISLCECCLELCGEDGNLRTLLCDYIQILGDVGQENMRFDDNYMLTPMRSYKRRGGGVEHSDNLTPWELYGSHLDVRTYHAGDLPNLFHVLHAIPLWGEQYTPPTAIGRIYQKALPFACQRRHIINFINETIAQDEAIWVLLSRLFWVTLAALYPGEAATTKISFRDVVRAKELTNNKKMLLDAIATKDTHKSGAPLVMYSVIRQHIVYMATTSGTAYVEAARCCVEWDHFVANAEEQATIVRESNLLPFDAFGRARARLSKTAKSPHARVHRIRRKSLVITLSGRMNEVLEKTIIKDKRDRTASLAATGGEDSILDYYHTILTMDCKAALVNLLIRIKPERRMSWESLAIMTLPEYGGISLESVAQIRKLVDIYYTTGKPLEFVRAIDAMNGADFVVAAFYVNTVAVLENVRFVALPAQMVEATDTAMLQRRYYGETELPQFAYTGYVSLCCERVLNLTGSHVYGTKYVTYDVLRKKFVCTKKKVRISMRPENADQSGDDEQQEEEEDDNEDEEEEEEEEGGEKEIDAFFNINTLLAPLLSKVTPLPKSLRTLEIEERKAVRLERKQFNRIPCGQPILLIPLRGRALLWGHRLEKQQLHLFCPRCASFHLYSPMNWCNSADGTYRCNACARTEQRHLAQPRCAYCSKTTPSQMSTRYKLLVTDPPALPPQAWLYFCKSHYDIARRFSSRMMKRELWNVIQKVEHRKHMNAAKKQ